MCKFPSKPVETIYSSHPAAKAL